MKIYRIGMYENPSTATLIAMKSVAYAHFSALGTWVSRREPCKACGWHWQEYGPPLLVRWEPSTNVLGDFSWGGPIGYTFVVKEAIAECLRALHFPCTFMPVEYVAPKGKGKSKCVPFPYDGPRLLWGCCKSLVELDMEASEVTVTQSCSECGRVSHTFRFSGITIRESDWHGEAMFRIATNDSSAATFVTEHGRELIEREGFTNVAFSEAGQIVK